MTGLNPTVIAGIANDANTISFLNALLPQLDAAALAGIVDGNGAWMADLVSGISPATVNTMINDLTPWVTGTLMPGLNTANIAAIANDPATINFINALLPQLNAASMAGVVNTNWGWLDDVVAAVAPGTVNNMISDLSPWITGTLLPGLNTANHRRHRQQRRPPSTSSTPCCRSSTRPPWPAWSTPTGAGWTTLSRPWLPEQ